MDASRHQNKGYGLIEVLVSMLVFALGVLGVAGMQGQAIRVTHDSLQRSQASWMAQEAFERIKVNLGGLDSGRYQLTATTASADIANYCSNPAPKQCIGSSCTPNEMTDYDINDLLCKNTGVVRPQLSIACTNTPCAAGDTVTINLSWDSRGATGGVYSTRQSLSLTMRR